MVRIIIRGSAAVFHGDDPVTDPAVLRLLGGLVYDEERFTDFLGGSPAADRVAAALEPGGSLGFGYREGEALLTAVTEYRSRRPLSDTELRLLVAYTMGQWSDGIGENWTGLSADRCGYTVMCLTPGEGVPRDYPSVQVVNE